MNSWVPLVPEYLTSSANRDPSSRITSFDNWVASVNDPGDYEVRFLLSAGASTPGSKIMIIGGGWAVDPVGTPEQLPEASLFGINADERAAEVGPFNAAHGPFYLVHESAGAGTNLLVRAVVSEARHDSPPLWKVPPLPFTRALLNKGPVWYTPFNDFPPATSVYDAVGAYSWTAYNGPTVRVQGQVNGAVEFTIIGQRVEATGNWAETQTGNFSLVLWYQSTVVSGTLRYLVSNRLVPGQQGITLYQSAANDLVFSATIGTTSTTMNLGSHDTGGKWRMVAITVSTGSGVTAYLDTVPVATDPTFKVSTGLPPASVVALGARPTTTANGYVGKMDEVAGFGYTLTPQDVEELYNRGKA